MTNLSLCYTLPSLSPALYSESYIKGSVFAIAACPEIPMPMEWIPWLIETPSDTINEAELSVLSEAAINELQLILAAMKDHQSLLPEECQFQEPHSQYLAQWCLGALHTHQKLESVWQHAWSNMSDKDHDMTVFQSRLKRTLSHISTFADVGLAKEQAEKRNAAQFNDKLPQLFQALPLSLRDYVDLSGTLASYLDNQFETFTQPQSQK